MGKSTATAQDSARVGLRQLTGNALLALLRRREDVSALETTEEGLAPTRPYVGCDALSLGDPEAPPSAAEEHCWRLSLAFLELEGLTGLEHEAAEVWDVSGEAVRVEHLARLTDEGERQALAMLSRWHIEAAPMVSAALRSTAAHASRALLTLPPAECRHSRALVEHGRQLLTDVRPLVEALDTESAPAFSAELWEDVKARAASHGAAILAHLEALGAATPERLRRFVLECLSLAHQLGASMDALGEERPRHA